MGKYNIVLGYGCRDCVRVREGTMKYLFVAKYKTDAMAGICQIIIRIKSRQSAIRDVYRGFKAHIRENCPIASTARLEIISCVRID